MTTTTPTTHARTDFAEIPLAHIATSLTNPRQRFDDLPELAESIKANGVVQAVLVRPLPAARLEDTAHLTPRPQWELVSGERRYRASEMAGKATIPAVVRVLTDTQVLEIQLIENLQRKDITALEEARGYEALRDHPLQSDQPALTVDQIATRIGKSRSYVYSRLKLLNLGPEGRQAMAEGWLDPSTALLVARMPSQKLQKDALGNLQDWQGNPLSYREAASLIERQYMLRLSEARFKITDAALLPSAGSCRECPKRTGADPDLFADIKGADICTDPACFKAKDAAHQAQSLKAARESGATIIEGREAKALIPMGYTGRVEGYLRLDNPEDSPTDKPLRKLIGKLLEEEGITPTLVANPHKEGDLIAIIDHATASRLLAKKGHQEQAELIEAKAKESAKAAEEAQKAKDKERFEKAWRMELLSQAWAKIGSADEGMYSVPDAIIKSLAIGHLPNQEGCKELCKLLDLGKVAPAEAMKDWINEQANPDRALALVLMYSDREYQPWRKDDSSANARLFTLATDTGVEISLEAVKAQVQKEHTEQIRARKKAQSAEAQKGSIPLNPAAQQSGVRGKGEKNPKGKKAQAAPAVPKITAEEAMQGIASAMQSNEAGGDSAPGESDQDGASAVGNEGRATSPDAGADQKELVDWPFPGNKEVAP